MNKIAKSLQPIAPNSEKQSKIERVYLKEAALYKLQHPECQLKLLGCTGRTTAVHHLHSGMNRQKYQMDKSTWNGVCAVCHAKVHDAMSAAEAKKIGAKLTESPSK